MKSEIEVFKTPTKKSLRPHGFTGKFYQAHKKEYCFLDSSKKFKRTFPNSFYEVSIILILKPPKDTTGKENCRVISLVNIDAKNLQQMANTLNLAAY